VLDVLLGNMNALLKFVVSVNQAIRARKTVCTTAASTFNKQIAIFLRDQGYFAAVAVTPEGLLLTFRYVGDIAPFKKLIVVSKSSRSVCFRRTTRLPGVFLMSSSDTTLSLKKTSLPASGKVLIQIL
jgi:ribosomal protein S8